MAFNNLVDLDRLSRFLTKVKALIPTKTSDLTNDSNFVTDASYVHTDSNYTATEKSKLSGIEAGAQVNTVSSVNSKTGAVTVTLTATYTDATGDLSITLS